LIVSILGLSIPFFLLGTNQAEYDNLSEDDLGNLEYNTWYGALVYTYHLALGDFNFDIFSVGD